MAAQFAIGLATLDFGAFPGKSDASVDVTGHPDISASSLVFAQLRPQATADHSVDEHLVETLKVTAGNIIAGTGFTIYGTNTSQLNEPVTPPHMARFAGTGQYAGPGRQDIQVRDIGGKETRIYGLWSVQWGWGF